MNIKTRRKIGAALGVIAMLSACGGGGSSTRTATPGPTASAPPPPPPSSSPCSLTARQNWAEEQIDEWYLFPETLPANRDPSPFGTVQDYIDFLTATARAQGRDRFFTFLTSIEEENAFINRGANAGFGIRLAFDASDRLFITEAFEGAPALEAGIDRGAEILAIGTSSSNLRTVSDIIAADGSAGLNAALGPSDPGVTRVLRIDDDSGTRNISVTKEEFELLPVSPRYGAQVISDGGRDIGYINLRTFISTADPALSEAFADFRAQGITEFVIDLRYNGGGLVRIADLMGDLLGRDRSPNDVFSFTTFRPSKSQFDETRFFESNASSVAPVKIAFIGTGGTASASELVINAFVPYLGADLALIGTDTFGKPVGQIAEDREECDDRLRIVAFKTENADREGEYFDGLAGSVDASCRAGDDIDFQLGNPNENSLAVALDFLAGRSCTAIASGATGQAVDDRPRHRELLRPRRPSPAQINTPGIY